MQSIAQGTNEGRAAIDGAHRPHRHAAVCGDCTLWSQRGRNSKTSYRRPAV